MAEKEKKTESGKQLFCQTLLNIPRMSESYDGWIVSYSPEGYVNEKGIFSQISLDKGSHKTGVFSIIISPSEDTDVVSKFRIPLSRLIRVTASQEYPHSLFLEFETGSEGEQNMLFRFRHPVHFEASLNYLQEYIKSLKTTTPEDEEEEEGEGEFEGEKVKKLHADLQFFTIPPSQKEIRIQKKREYSVAHPSNWLPAPAEKIDLDLTKPRFWLSAEIQIFLKKYFYVFTSKLKDYDKKAYKTLLEFFDLKQHPRRNLQDLHLLLYEIMYHPEWVGNNSEPSPQDGEEELDAVVLDEKKKEKKKEEKKKEKKDPNEFDYTEAGQVLDFPENKLRRLFWKDVNLVHALSNEITPFLELRMPVEYYAPLHHQFLIDELIHENKAMKEVVDVKDDELVPNEEDDNVDLSNELGEELVPDKRREAWKLLYEFNDREFRTDKVAVFIKRNRKKDPWNQAVKLEVEERFLWDAEASRDNLLCFFLHNIPYHKWVKALNEKFVRFDGDVKRKRNYGDIVHNRHWNGLVLEPFNRRWDLVMEDVYFWAHTKKRYSEIALDLQKKNVKGRGWLLSMMEMKYISEEYKLWFQLRKERKAVIRKAFKYQLDNTIKQYGTFDLGVKHVLSHPRVPGSSLGINLIEAFMKIPGVKYGICHAYVMIGNIAIHWGEQSLVVITDSSFQPEEKEDVFSVDVNCPVIVSSQTLVPLLGKLARLIVDKNTNWEYRRTGYLPTNNVVDFESTKKESCNCQEFCDSLLDSLKRTRNFPIVDEYMRLFRQISLDTTTNKSASVIDELRFVLFPIGLVHLIKDGLEKHRKIREEEMEKVKESGKSGLMGLRVEMNKSMRIPFSVEEVKIVGIGGSIVGGVVGFFGGKTKDQELNEKYQKVFFRTHRDIDIIYNLLAESNVLYWKEGFPGVHALLKAFDRSFWMRYFNLCRKSFLNVKKMKESIFPPQAMSRLTLREKYDLDVCRPGALIGEGSCPFNAGSEIVNENETRRKMILDNEEMSLEIPKGEDELGNMSKELLVRLCLRLQNENQKLRREMMDFSEIEFDFEKQKGDNL